LQKGSSYGGGHGTIYVSDISADGDDEVVVDGILDLTALARASLAAMREPTEEALARFRRAQQIAHLAYHDSKEAEARACALKDWHDMIDAALTSSENG
jgi:hypothetical protein